jgi:flagellar protein FliS
MIYGNNVVQYRKTNIETAGNLELIIICYEKAVQALKKARESYENKDFEKKARSLLKALDIIMELKCALDFERGGQIAKNLDAIYSFMTKSLLESDIKGDMAAFDWAIGTMLDLKEAWEGVSVSFEGSAKETSVDGSYSQESNKRLAP